MTELGIILRRVEAEDARQIGFALAAALFLHVILAVIAQVNYSAVEPLHILPAIEVRLIPSTPLQTPAADAPIPDTPSQIAKPSEPAQIAKPADSAVLEPAPIAAPIIIPPPILNSETGSSRGAFPERPADDRREYIPSDWALEPPLKGERLKGLGLLNDVDCLRSLSEDCASLRKEVFAEFELTEMEKVWTPARADTGMSSEFYGLSEREIRLKVGSKIAGENGLMIFPGIAIDGELWDMLHGIKKGCKMKRGIDSSGTYGVVRVCPKSLPAARNRKNYIPPKQ